MKSYYFMSPRGSEFLYIDCILFSYRHINEVRPHNQFSPKVLRNLCLSERSGILSRERLEERGWEVETIEVNDQLVKDFMNSCFKGRSKRRLNKSATEIFNWVSERNGIFREDIFEEDSSYNGVQDTGKPRKIVHEGGYKEVIPPEDDEDRKMDWWLEGDKPPFYS